MSSENKSKNSKKKPFKWTKELIRLALNDGWTQKDIAEKCRTQQSIVSAWSRGSKQGTEQQLLPLLNIYGYKLRRNTFKVYWSLGMGDEEKTFYRVEGKVILSHVFYDARRNRQGKFVKKIPKFKLVIHHQGSDQFRIVAQQRIIFTNTDEILENSVEDAIWSSEVSDSVNTKELIDIIDRYAKITLLDHPSDANTLPFLIRRALINYGLTVDYVVDYPAIW